MAELNIKAKTHPSESELADYLSKTLSEADRSRIEGHIASCDECLDKAVSAYEAVGEFKKRRTGNIMKKINIYLTLAIITFILSFIIQRYFLQFLAATLILGIKWVSDSKSTKMLIMIYEAWKRGGDKEAARILSSLEAKPKNRL